MLIPGLVSVTFKRLSVDEIISLVSLTGLKAIEWSENHHIRPGDKKEAQRIKALMDENNLLVACYGSYFKLSLGMDIIPSLENAKAMGAKCVRIWGGAKASDLISREERNDMIKEAQKCADIASSYGLDLALEWHRDTLTDRNDYAISFIKDVNRDNFRSLWQPTPDLSSSERIRGLMLLKDLLLNIHVYYWDDDIRRPLIEGEECWKKYLSAVSGDHYALLEFVKDDSIDQFKKDAETLISWVEEPLLL